MRDIAIIDAFPVHDCQKKVLTVGCGEGRIEYQLAERGCKVFATDIEEQEAWCNVKYLTNDNLGFYRSDIFDLSSFPIKSSPIVICSQVLEHLSNYKLALIHLLALTEVRLIITVPHRTSFKSPDHINFWDDTYSRAIFKDIDEFVTICHPYSTTISKILTKPQDAGKQYGYLIIVDKRQKLQ